jgi:hypothetical protein
MTSEPDSTPQRRPSTIELTATEVDGEKPAKEGGEAAAAADRVANGDAHRNPAGEAPTGRLRSHAVGAIIGVIATGAIVAGLWLAGYVPSRAPAPEPNGATAATSDEISQRLAKIESALKTQRPDAAFGERLAVAEAQTKSLGETLTALNRRVDDLATAAQGALAQAKAADSTAADAKNSAQSSVQHSDLDALSSRIGALESAVKSLSDDVAHRASSANDLMARSTVAAEALRASVERGAPYQNELALVKSLGADANATASLDQFAASGVPSAAALAHELQTLLPALLQAAGAASNEGSFMGRIEANAQNLVRITPIDAPQGEEPAAGIARLNADAARADIDAALADIAKLPDSAKSLAADWVRKAEARKAAIVASRRIAAGALAALGKPVSQ